MPAERACYVKKKIVMVIVLGLVVLALGVGGVYAYFAATVTQDTTSNVSKSKSIIENIEEENNNSIVFHKVGCKNNGSSCLLDIF